MANAPQIAVLNAGGQYCHLIARKVRELGVSAEVYPSDCSATHLKHVRGLIVSGGPASVYEATSPKVDPEIFDLGVPILGICYGHQLMAHLLGGRVEPGTIGEYGLAELEVVAESPLFAGLPCKQQVWMSHRDLVVKAAPGFEVIGRTPDCALAAVADHRRQFYGLQFHPEVVHTTHGSRILANFVFEICRCQKDWDPEHQVERLKEQIREQAAGKNVFFFVSGGVDSTVAFVLTLSALGPERVRGVYVDTGLMRKGETELVERSLKPLAAGSFQVVDASPQFLSALEGVVDPEEKRRIIGQTFLRIQDQLLSTVELLNGRWLLGQGTIYPDRIESGGATHAAVIKTHHNRVEAIQRLIEAGAVLEPLAEFYKDEVRAIGRQLGLPDELIERHPFPGPGLAIRCLCSTEVQPVRPQPEGWLLPVRSVGVQGDERSYRAVMAIEGEQSEELVRKAASIVNQRQDINRVVRLAGSKVPPQGLQVHKAGITEDRLNLLREADAVVRELSRKAGYDRNVWQFPVILIPVGTKEEPESIVLRPVDSVDGMTARAVLIDEDLLAELTLRLLKLPGIAALFQDLTHKPPGTIEWE